jgi:hypothetical protein
LSDIITVSSIVGEKGDDKKLRSMLGVYGSKGMIGVLGTYENNDRIAGLQTDVENYQKLIVRRDFERRQLSATMEAQGRTKPTLMQSIPMMVMNFKIDRAQKKLDKEKRDLFRQYMSADVNDDTLAPLVPTIVNSRISSDGKLLFGSIYTTQALENLQANREFAERVDWSKADRSKVLQYLAKGDMLGLTEYLSTTQRAKIPVLSSMKDKMEGQQQISQILGDGKVSAVQTMLTKLMFSPISLMESVFTVFKSPALSLSSDEKTLLEELKGKKSVNELVGLANTDIPNISATGVPTMQEADHIAEQRLRTLFALARPDMSADEMLARYNYIRDNFEFAVLDSITIDMLCDDTYFIVDQNGKLFSTSVEFEAYYYGKLLGGTTYKHN